MSSIRSRAQQVRRVVRRQVLARRRLLVALLTAGAVAAGLHSVAGPPPPTVVLTTAARDLPAGTVLGSGDLRNVEVPPEAVPAGVVDDAAGRTLAAPLRSGEPITDVRLVGASLAAAHPGLTALPVRLPDPGSAALLEAGDRIDLVATDPQRGGSRVVAYGALVLAVPQSSDEGPSEPVTGAVVVLAVDPGAVADVADAAARLFLTYAFSR
jgi:Flp pilus assembly protein CpaB